MRCLDFQWSDYPCDRNISVICELPQVTMLALAFTIKQKAPGVDIKYVKPKLVCLDFEWRYRNRQRLPRNEFNISFSTICLMLNLLKICLKHMLFDYQHFSTGEAVISFHSILYFPNDSFNVVSFSLINFFWLSILLYCCLV